MRALVLKHTIVALWMLSLGAGPALSHASEQGFVLLLPTDIYTNAGVTAVAATVVLLALLPEALSKCLFRPLHLWPISLKRLRFLSCALSTGLLFWMIWRGLVGDRDPLDNPMPLLFWTVWWVALVSLQGVFGNIWQWIDPLRVPVHLSSWSNPVFRYPASMGYWPAAIGFLLFAGFLLADIAPTDPNRLALVVAFYVLATCFAVMLFGRRWIVRAEFVSVMMRSYGRVGLFGRARGRVSVGLWGWLATTQTAPPLSLAVLFVLLLGTGSFDGLNETFWWINFLGLNPLEFPGRSFVVLPSLIGLIVSNALLIGVFATSLWLGAQISNDRRSLPDLFRAFAPSILPIALGYHIAHYLTTFLVDGQYVLQIVDDPLGRGWHLLGLQDFFVTTGFFNRQSSVQVIWLTQAGAVVLGHIIAVLMAHRIALRDGATSWGAFAGQFPLALFMIAYTFLGLWLLATPRGA